MEYVMVGLGLYEVKKRFVELCINEFLSMELRGCMGKKEYAEFSGKWQEIFKREGKLINKVRVNIHTTFMPIKVSRYRGRVQDDPYTF